MGGKARRAVTTAAAAAAAVNCVAAALLIAAWYLSAEAVRVPDQLAWVSVAVLAVVGAILADALVVLTGRRALMVQRLTLSQLIGEPSPDSVVPVTVEPVEDGAPARKAPARPVVVNVPGAVRYHRPNCQLVEGKIVRRADPAKDGLRPCGMCRP